MTNKEKIAYDEFAFSCQLSEYRRCFGEHLTIEQAAYAVGLKPVILKKLISLDIIEAESEESVFRISVKSLPEIRKIARLHYDLGIGWNSMGLVLDLLKRIDELESRL